MGKVLKTLDVERQSLEKARVITVLPRSFSALLAIGGQAGGVVLSSRWFVVEALCHPSRPHSFEP
jgi:lipid-binding SYLF domain-containing protein